MSGKWQRFMVRYFLLAVLGCVAIAAATTHLGLTESPIDPKIFEPVAARIDAAVDAIERPSPTPPAPPPTTTPSTTGPRAATRKVMDSSRWAVTTNSAARVYDAHGKLQGRVPPGTPVTVSDIRRTDDYGNLAVVSFSMNGTDFSKLLISTSDLDVTSLSPATITPQEKRLRSQRAALAGELAQLGEDRHEALKSRNPHRNTYNKARKAYLDARSRAKALKDRMASATGGERMRCAEELRAMKGNDTRLARELVEAKKAMTEWQDTQMAGLSPTPRMQQLGTELAAIETRLAAVTASP